MKISARHRPKKSAANKPAKPAAAQPKPPSKPRTADTFVPASTAPAAPTRPPVVREVSELGAVWRTVESIEKGVYLNNGDRGQCSSEPYGQWREDVRPHLLDFIKFGKSTLTPYEAKALYDNLAKPSFPDFTSRKADSLVTGDRVEFPIDVYGDRPGRGVVVGIDAKNKRALVMYGDPQGHRDNVQFQPTSFSRLKVTTSALEDGR